MNFKAKVSDDTYEHQFRAVCAKLHSTYSGIHLTAASDQSSQVAQILKKEAMRQHFVFAPKERAMQQLIARVESVRQKKKHLRNHYKKLNYLLRGIIYQENKRRHIAESPLFFSALHHVLELHYAAISDPNCDFSPTKPVHSVNLNKNLARELHAFEDNVFRLFSYMAYHYSEEELQRMIPSTAREYFA